MLNNKKAKIEIRYPNGKVAHKIKYSLKEPALEDARYEKAQIGWAWIKKNIQKNAEVKTAEFVSNVIENKKEDDSSTKIAETLKSGGQSLIENKKNFQEKIVLVIARKNEPKIENYLLVPKTDDLSMENNHYIFADYYVPQKHYAVRWWEGISREVNLLLREFFK